MQAKIKNYTPRMLLSLMVVLFTVACAPVYKSHGFVPPATEVDQIIIGSDTMVTVESLLGRPTVSGVVRDDAWYYVSSKFKHYTFHKPKEVDRTILVIGFNQETVVEDVQYMGLEDGEIVNLNTRVTETRGERLTVLRQLLGTLGQFDPTQMVGGN